MTTPKTRPLGRNRWTFFNDRAGGDHLVHTVLAAHATQYDQSDDRLYPVEGISECGLWVSLFINTKGRAQQGVYVDDSHMLTCIRCLSGCSTDGISFRAEQKNAKFAQLYGKNVNNVSARVSKPRIPMQNFPIQGSAALIRGHAASAVVVDEVQVYLPWLAAWCASLPKKP